MTKQRTIHFLLMGILAFIGGLTAEPLLRAGQSFAQSSDQGNKSFYDQNGRLRFEMGMVNGQPVENILGEDGKLRIQIGTYDGQVNGSEKGLPAITLYDNEGRLKMLFRVATGNNQSPVLVMKDNHQRDRIVMGLSLDNADEDPFLAYFDKDGGKHMAFGIY